MLNVRIGLDCLCWILVCLCGWLSWIVLFVDSFGFLVLFALACLLGLLRLLHFLVTFCYVILGICCCLLCILTFLVLVVPLYRIDCWDWIAFDWFNWC